MLSLQTQESAYKLVPDRIQLHPDDLVKGLAHAVFHRHLVCVQLLCMCTCSGWRCMLLAVLMLGGGLVRHVMWNNILGHQLHQVQVKVSRCDAFQKVIFRFEC